MPKENSVHKEFVGPVPKGPEIGVVRKQDDPCPVKPSDFQRDTSRYFFRILFRNIPAQQGVGRILDGVLITIAGGFQVDVSVPKEW